MPQGRARERSDEAAVGGRTRGKAASPARPGALAARMPYADRLTHKLLTEQYVERKRSVREIASDVGCSPRDVLAHLKAFGFSVRRRIPTRPQPLEPRRGKG